MFGIEELGAYTDVVPVVQCGQHLVYELYRYRTFHRAFRYPAYVVRCLPIGHRHLIHLFGVAHQIEVILSVRHQVVVAHVIPLFA